MNCVESWVIIVPVGHNLTVWIGESITVGTKPDVIEVSPTVSVPLWCRRDIGKEFYTVRVHE
jgi:hypothetical protein